MCSFSWGLVATTRSAVSKSVFSTYSLVLAIIGIVETDLYLIAAKEW